MNRWISASFLEWLHDFKAGLWCRVRRFFRGQFTDEARDSFREGQGKLGKKSQVVGATGFARIPLLNESQLVERWKLVTPPAIVSETQQLPIDGLGAGVYLIEATDGTYKAYTIAIVTRIALVERAGSGRADLYVADRKKRRSHRTGRCGALVRWTRAINRQDKRGRICFADHESARRRAGSNSGKRLDSGAARRRCGDHYALRLWLRRRQCSRSQLLYLYRPPGLPARAHGTYQGRGSAQKDDALLLPEDRTLELTVKDADGKFVFKQDLPVSAHGTVTAELTLEADAALGYY